MARSFRLVTPDRLQIREGGGAIAVFGLPFFAAGVFLVLTVLGVVPVSNAGQMHEFAWPAFMLMGAAFTAVGGTLVFGRSWTTIDTAQRTVSKQWGLVLPFGGRTFPLDGYTAVTLGFVQGDSDTSDRFPVGLKGSAAADLPLCSFTAYPQSRESAAAVALHLRLPVEDATTDHPIRLSSSEFDRPFPDQVWRQRVPRETASRPAQARSEVSREGNAVRIVIPRPPLHPLVVAGGLIPVAIPLVFASSLATFFRRTSTPEPVAWTALGVIMAFFVVLPAMTLVNAYLRSRRGRTIALVSPQGINIQERGAWSTRIVAAHAAEEILDLDYSTRGSTVAAARRAAEQRVHASDAAGPALDPRIERVLASLSRFAHGRGLTIKTRHGFTTFGESLEDDEIEYLYAAILQAFKPGADGVHQSPAATP
jgi:hypothetical protein